MPPNAPTLVSIIGPTAVGKTRLSIQLAEKWACPIISADSRQFYREISIGTAKPTQKERNGIPHYFIDSHSVKDTFSAGDFEREGLELLNDLFKAHNKIVLVGGSGMYVKALCEGLDEMPAGDEILRSELKLLYQEKGIAALQEKIALLDPDYFEKAEKQNPQRLMRAIEICLVSGKKISELRSTSTSKKRPFQIRYLGLELPRELLYDQINKRVDSMMENGLLQEVKDMIPYKSHYALQTVGYKELFDYFEGKVQLDEAIGLIKKNTRNYAKRQLTWFKKLENVNWVDAREADIKHIENDLML